MSQFRIAITRRMFLKIGLQSLAALGLSWQAQTLTAASPSVSERQIAEGYGLGAYGQGEYPAFSHFIYLPLVSKEQ